MKPLSNSEFKKFCLEWSAQYAYKPEKSIDIRNVPDGKRYVIPLDKWRYSDDIPEDGTGCAGDRP